MSQQVFYSIFIVSLLCNTKCALISVHEDFNNKIISLDATNWKCGDQTTKPIHVFHCDKGMSLVVLEQSSNICHQIQRTFEILLPHFKIQLYIDVYGYRTLDGGECIEVDVTNSFQVSRICLNPHSQKTQGKLEQCASCNDQYNYQIRKSIFQEINHEQQQVEIIIKSQTDDAFDNESYLFRNLQIFSYRCYKTCLTCSGEGKDECLTCYNGIQPNIDGSCNSCKNIPNSSFLQIPQGCKEKCVDNQGYDDDYICNEEMYIQSSCEDDCELCTNTQSCLVCKPLKYLHFGQCIDGCPNYTQINQQYCLNPFDILRKNKIKIQLLVQEFHDLSTNNNWIKQQFNKEETIGLENFLKGDEIYYSYLSNKRIFGGPFVWVNAKFKFTQSWTQEILFIRISFEVILGDSALSNSQLQYKINDQSPETIILNNSYQKTDLDIEDQNWPNDYKFNVYQVDKTLSYEKITYKELTIYFSCQNINAIGFCGIQNFIIAGFSGCEPAYKFNLFYYENNINPCIPICGDKIIVGDEECDDGNNDPFDGCFNCRYQCEEQCINCINGYCLSLLQQNQQRSIEMQIEYANYQLSYDLDAIQLSCIFNCSHCINNVCLECNYGYYFNPQENLCIAICGDSILQGNEQCDDGNYDNYDGCSNCQLIQYEKCDTVLQIEKHHCSVCYYGKCLKCNEGFTLDNDTCIQICGDGLLNLEKEECDSPDDQGCIDCKIQNGYVCGILNYSACHKCDNECTQCTSTNKIDLICKSCIDGYYLDKDNCYKCDSNCITCELQSSLCTSCFREDCDFCESIPGLISNIKTKRCISTCGDGIVVETYEQCDDNNLINGDGCDSFCNLEFTDNDLDQMRNYRFQGNNTYDLMINSQYQLYLLCNTSNITIDNFDALDFNYSSTQVDNSTCRLLFGLMKSILQINTIHVILQYSSSYTNNRLLLEDNKQIQFQITPTESIVLNEDQLKQQEYIKSAQQQFSLLFLTLIPISIITNLFHCLWAVLQILSWINNFYFLNVTFPFNVEILFLNSNWSSFISFPTYQGLNQPGCNYYFEAPKRFMDKGIDPLFFNNIQIPFMFILSSIIIYTINYLLYLFFSLLNNFFKQNISLKNKHISIFNIQFRKQIRQNSIKAIQQQVVENQYLKFITTTLKSSLIHLTNQLKSTISLCLLDITLAISLQLSFSNNSTNLIVGLNQFFATIAIIIIIFQLFQQYQILNIHKLKAKNKYFENQYGIYYENINIEKQFGYYYQLLGQISKILYIVFMVNQYDTPLNQVTLCYLSSSFGFIFLLYENPFDSRKEYILQLISNFCLSSIILIIVLFAINDHTTIWIIEKNKIILGWFIISLVLLAILVEISVLIFGLLMYFYKIYQVIFDKLKKFCVKKEKNQNQEQQLNQTKFKTQKNTTHQESSLFKPKNQHFSIVLF